MKFQLIIFYFFFSFNSFCSSNLLNNFFNSFTSFHSLSSSSSSSSSSSLKEHSNEINHYLNHLKIKKEHSIYILCYNNFYKQEISSLFTNYLKKEMLSSLISKKNNYLCSLIYFYDYISPNIIKERFKKSYIYHWSPIYPIIKISSHLMNSLNIFHQYIQNNKLKTVELPWKQIQFHLFYQTGTLSSFISNRTSQSLVHHIQSTLSSEEIFLQRLQQFLFIDNENIENNDDSNNNNNNNTNSRILWKNSLKTLQNQLSSYSTSVPISTSSSKILSHFQTIKQKQSILSRCQFDQYLKYNPDTTKSFLKISGIDQLLLSKSISSNDKLLCIISIIISSSTDHDLLYLTLSYSPTLRGTSTISYGPELIESGLNTQGTGRIYSNIGLNGTNIVIGLSDSGIDDRSCYFQNYPGLLPIKRFYLNTSSLISSSIDYSQRKIIQYIAYNNGVEDLSSGHGTHVASILTGSSISTNLQYSQYNGIASGSKIAFLDIGGSDGSNMIPPDDFFSFSRQAGANIQSISWGTDITDYYTYFDEYLDVEIFNSQNTLVVFVAVGNTGPNLNTVASPALSKNCIAIGATDGFTLATFSSRGPTFDQRYGVDLLAPGVNVYTALSSGKPFQNTCQTSNAIGTSISAPAAAGSAALVIQYYKDSKYWASNCQNTYKMCFYDITLNGTIIPVGFQPSSSLVKGTLIHSGQNIDPNGILGYKYPGVEQGFGQIQLNKVLVIKDITPYGFDLFIDEIILSNYSSVNYTIQVLGSTLPLKVTICWIDPPNSIIATKQLLNDVDLTIIDPKNQIWYGNNNTNGDDTNTVEIIEILSPILGNYYVNISIKELGLLTSQNVSVIITSIGRVTNVHLTDLPTSSPTIAPSPVPSIRPTFSPSCRPSRRPTKFPTRSPTRRPTRPTVRPTFSPSSNPTISIRPTLRFIPPTRSPTRPTSPPTLTPTSIPTLPPKNPTARPIFVFH